jgi:UDP-2,3-diacylglucosamine hydrolase
MIPRLGYAFGYRWSARNRKKHDSIENTNRHHNYYEAHTTDTDAFQVEWAKQFSAKHPDVNYIIMGHLHQEVNMRLASGCQLLILDEFYKNYGYAIYDGTYLWPENFDTIDAPV